MNRSDKKWPDDYQSWSGRFEELIETANEVLLAQNPNAHPFTARSARHYQQLNILSKGEKKGREAFFSQHDLFSLLATREMIKDGWKLSQTASVLRPQSQSFSGPISGSLDSAAPSAVDVVNTLLRRSDPAFHASAPAVYNIYNSAGTLGNKESKDPNSAVAMAVLNASYGAPLSPQANQHPCIWIDAVPWMGVHLKPMDAKNASTQEKNTAIAHLEALAQRLKTGDLS